MNKNIVLDGSISIFQQTGSVALELSIHQVNEFIVGLLILKEGFYDSFSVNDITTKKTLVFIKHQNYEKAVVKGKLRTRSTIVRNNSSWTFLVTANDLELIVKWYLQSIVSVNSNHSRFNNTGAVLDIECDDASTIMFTMNSV